MGAVVCEVLVGWVGAVVCEVLVGWVQWSVRC